MKSNIASYQLTFLADELFSKIKNNKDFFHTVVVVVPSLKMEQWLKAYWLKTQKEVLFNVKFVPLKNFINEIIISEEKYQICNKKILRDAIIKTIADDYDIPLENKNYIKEKNGEIDGAKLFDLAEQFSQLFLDYEADLIDDFKDRQAFYLKVINTLNKNNCTTLKKYYENKIKLKKKDPYTYLFGFTDLTKLEKAILEEYGFEIDEYGLDFQNDIDVKLTTAPSMIREIEAVHTEICHLLNSGEANYSDILVLAPDIEIYESTINRVFKQDNINFPSISHVVIAKNNKKGNTFLLIQTLYEILNKGFFTRLDFFNILNNPIVQQVRNIDAEQIDSYLKSIIELNIYRNRDNFDDWDYLKKRILLSKLTDTNRIDDNIALLNGKEYIPYSNIDLDDNLVVKLINAINDLEEFLNNVGQLKYVDNQSIDIVINEIKKWASINNEDDLENNNEFKPVLKLAERWKTFNFDGRNVPIEAFLLAVLDASDISIFNGGSYFTSGITFANYDPKTILASKYIFFIGLDSKSLPKIKTKSEIDIREDSDDTYKDYLNFVRQYQNSGKRFYISYINKDLKTDEEYYPSTYIIKLFLDINKIKNDGTSYEKQVINLLSNKIDIDENRKWNELFTKREFKNKNYYLGLSEIDDVDATHLKKDIDSPQIFNKGTPVLKANHLKNYLVEPLKFKATLLFGNEDDLEDEIKEEYEPLNIDNLTSSKIRKEIATELLKNKSDINPTLKAKFKKQYLLENKLVTIDPSISDIAFDGLVNEASNIYHQIKTLSNDYQVVNLSDLKINHPSLGDWLISGQNPFCLIKEDEKTRTYIEIDNFLGSATAEKRNEIILNNEYFSPYRYKDSLDKLINIYIYSLLDLVNLDEEQNYEIRLLKDLESNVTYHATPKKARDILNKIYEGMFDFSDNYYLHINLLENDKIEKYPDLINEVKNSGWNYFESIKLFDLENDLGYSQSNFKDEFDKRRIKQRQLILFLDNSGGEDDE